MPRRFRIKKRRGWWSAGVLLAEVFQNRNETQEHQAQIKTMLSWRRGRARGRPAAASTPQVRAACRGQPGRQVALAASRPGPGLIKDVEPNWSCQHLFRLRTAGREGGRVGGWPKAMLLGSASLRGDLEERQGGTMRGAHVPKNIENQRRMGQMETKERLFKHGHLVE